MSAGTHVDPTLFAGAGGVNPAQLSANPAQPNGVPPAAMPGALADEGGSPLRMGGESMSAQEQEMHQKDQELAQFLLKMDAYRPLIPDEVAAYYLERAGCDVSDVRVRRLLALACQKFVSDVAQDAFSYARTRASQAPGGRQAGSGPPGAPSGGAATAAPGPSKKDRARTVLTQEDLAQALAEYGINASRAPYYL